MENRKRKEECLQSIGVVLLVWSGIFILNNFLMEDLIERLCGKEGIIRYVVTSLINQVIVVGVPAIGLLYSCKNRIGKGHVTVSTYIIAIFLTMILWNASHIFVDGCKWLFLGTSKEYVVIYGFMEATPMETLIYFLTTTALAAFCEELLYRVAFIKYLAGVPMGFAVFLTSILFSVAHIGNGWSNVFVTLLLGGFLAYCYQKTKSYFLVVCMHYFFNALEIVFTYIICLPTDSSLVYEKVESTSEIIFWGLRYIAFSLLIFIVFLMLIYFCFYWKKRQKSNVLMG